MLSLAQEKRIRALLKKKGRQKHGQCIVEGAKVVATAGDAVEYTFTRADTPLFDTFVSTETPQEVAGIAHTPAWSMDDVTARPTIVVLDGVQDPGNVGAILRLCLGFDAGLVLVESVDVTNPKVVRSSVGALFQVPWVVLPRAEAVATIAEVQEQTGAQVFRLEKREPMVGLQEFVAPERAILVAGSEGQGIHLPLEGASVAIPHNTTLESLNVGHAIAIALQQRYTTSQSD